MQVQSLKSNVQSFVQRTTLDIVPWAYGTMQWSLGERTRLACHRRRPAVDFVKPFFFTS